MFGAVVIFQAVLVSTVLADTPANCTYEDIRGTWSFHLGPSGFDNSVNCASNFREEKKITIDLTYPDVANDQDGNEGFWTLIYNQGFEVVIENRKYFAFSKYSEESSKKVVSYCNTTFNGWSHDIQGNNWACYYGVKVADELSPVKSTKLDAEILDQKYIKNMQFINDINRETELWKAVYYPELEGMTYRERLQRAGGIPNHGGLNFPSRKAATTMETQKAVRELPVNFDWRSNNGMNYVSPIRNQGKCGSCYAFGSMAMLEARMRLISNNTKQPVFSTQDIVSCSEYSQGCDGGFPYLIAGKYTEDFGIVEESCFPYKGTDSIACRNEHAGCLRYRATNYHYIGGYYGACNEALMQMELVKNGPIAVSFEVTDDFQAYKSGIYHKVGVSDGFNPWEVTNHVVAIVGYGVENGVKYWTVKNSWGESWGESGFFRIMRGNDELNIESMAVAATPIVP